VIAIRGTGSKIVRELIQRLPFEEKVFPIGRHEKAPLDAERYLFCQGSLNSRRLAERSDTDIANSWLANAGSVIRACDRILENNSGARICVIGSESGFSWSHDGAYAAAKAALHRYVETRPVGRNQQLICIAPWIIADCAMTMRRLDRDNLVKMMEQHPKGRFLRAEEIAQWVKFLLYDSTDYVTSIVIRVHGGRRAAGQRAKDPE
jgi:NAD(P)-dependent dehydrogenase (short-subunit alcohol dehydrogenase family)